MLRISLAFGCTILVISVLYVIFLIQIGLELNPVVTALLLLSLAALTALSVLGIMRPGNNTWRTALPPLAAAIVLLRVIYFEKVLEAGLTFNPLGLPFKVQPAMSFVFTVSLIAAASLIAIFCVRIIAGTGSFNKS